MNPYIRVDDIIIEVGGSFTGQVTYEPEPGNADRVRGLMLELRWDTQGRGDQDGEKVNEIRLPVLADGRIDSAWSVRVPPVGPISYHGELMAIQWQLTATLDVRRRVDPSWSQQVIVVPRNGRLRYDGPHPLRG